MADVLFFKQKESGREEYKSVRRENGEAETDAAVWGAGGWEIQFGPALKGFTDKRGGGKPKGVVKDNCLILNYR